MPGSWETLDNASVLVGILHTDVTTIAWALGLRNLQIPGGGVLPVAGMPYDMARNAICMRALEVGASHVLMYDSDVIAPPDTIPRLLARDKPIISGMYCRRSPPHGVPVAIKNGQWLTGFRPGDVVEVDVVGAGCLLIRRDVLENLKPARPGKHWFSWQVDIPGEVPAGEAMSEDFVFCLQARKQLGIPILLDTSVVCRHVGYSQVLPGSMMPLEAVTQT